MKKTTLLVAVMVAVAFSASAQTVQLTGAGATFPQPLYVKMFDEYKKATKTEVNYQGVGSGAGVNQLIAKTVDFGASDAPMNADQIAKAVAEVVHIPTCVGAIVVTYNIPGFKGSLKFTGPVLADIYLGKITKWDDEAISKLNTGVKLPDMNIVVVRRADASGTSFNWTGYLTKESPDWASSVGQNTNPKWPVGVGGKGNPGVAAYVKQVPGSIGYVEIAYAIQNKMPVAIVQNKAGNWIDPNKIATVSEAANIEFPADGKADLIDSSAPNGYPISTTTWLLVYKDQTYTGNKAKSEAVMKALWWMLHDGQKYNEAQGYAKLPMGAVKVAETLMKSVTYNGESLLP
jgi:phosphate transport system substrate-binding protein